MVGPGRGAHCKEQPRALEIGQLCELLEQGLLVAKPLIGPSPDKCRMPDGRPEHDNPALGGGLAVSSPDVLAQLRDAGGRIDLADGENACFPFIGSNPAMRFDSRNDHVAGGACPRWRGREDVEVVQESQQSLSALELRKGLLEPAVLP